MKRLKYIPVLLMTLMWISSCDGMMDTHKEFIKDGETVYAPMPDTLYLSPGRERIGINYIISHSPNADGLLVEWDQGAQSEYFQLEHNGEGNSEGIFFIENLQEKSYQFDIRVMDIFGNTSLKTQCFGQSYGAPYESTLQACHPTDITASENIATIEWSPVSDTFCYNEVVYNNAAGENVTVKVMPDDRVTHITDYKVGSSIRYRSAYRPTRECVDDFFTPWEDSADKGLTFPRSYTMTEEGIDRNKWDILLCESEHPGDGDGIRAILDGNPDSYWHSGYNEHRHDCPFCFIIDMKDPLWIGEIGVMQRRGGYNYRMTRMRIEISPDSEFIGKDANNWITIADINPWPSDDMEWFKIDLPVIERNINGRFLKVTVTDTWDHDGITGLAEFAVKRIK